MNMPTVVVQKLNENAKIPCKPKSFEDAGWDVYPIKRLVIPAKGDALIGTGLKVQIPNGYCIQVNPRSGKAVKNKLTIGARVIDAPYRGELMIHVFNKSTEDYEVSPHDPIAQLLVLQCASLLVEGVINDETVRGADGFGSTDGKLKYESMHSYKSEVGEGATAEAIKELTTIFETGSLARRHLISKIEGSKNWQGTIGLSLEEGEYLLRLIQADIKTPH